MLTDVSEELTESVIIALMDAVSAYETLVNIYQTTRRYNLEDSHLHPQILQA
jgi:hypothetical protein